jgi:hypothetical protein
MCDIEAIVPIFLLHTSPHPVVTRYDVRMYFTYTSIDDHLLDNIEELPTLKEQLPSVLGS